MPNNTLPKRQVTFALQNAEEDDLTNLIVIFNQDDILATSQIDLLSNTIKVLLQHVLLEGEKFKIIEDFGDVIVTSHIEIN